MADEPLAQPVVDEPTAPLAGGACLADDDDDAPPAALSEAAFGFFSASGVFEALLSAASPPCFAASFSDAF